MNDLKAPGRSILVTVTGRDTPGITAALTGAIAQSDARLLDIEQVVVQRQLTLCLLLDVDPDAVDDEDEGREARGAVLKELLFTAKRMGLDMNFQVLESSPEQEDVPRPRYAVTAIGDGLTAGGVQLLAQALARHEANIESIRRLSSSRLLSLEVLCSLPSAEGASALRRALMEAVGDRDIDVAVQRERLTRRAKRLVVFDMDSTLIQIEVIDELARAYGVVDRVSDITHRAMAGELDYEASLRERVSLLKGMPYEDVLALAKKLPVQHGARDMLTVLRKLGYKTAVISGGFTFAANALKEELGLDYAYANELEVSEGKLTGRVLDPVVTPQRKADLLDAIAQREGIALEQTIAIGDGANDMGMLERAGLGIAFHAKAKLRAAADTSVSAGGLDRILYLLGLHGRDVEELL